MTEQVKNCWGCVHRVSRLRGTTPRTWCARFKIVTNTRCADYRFKPSAVDAAMLFLRRMGKGLKA